MLGFMALDFFQKSPLLLLPLLSLAIFLTVFITVTLRAMLTDEARIDALSRLPLADAGHGVPSSETEAEHV